MAKRKAGVNEIIFELDNDDIEISSEDEANGKKIRHFETKSSSELTLSQSTIDGNIHDVILINSSMDDSCNNESETDSPNGGKNSPVVMVVKNNKNTINDNDQLECMVTPFIERNQKNCVDDPETIILNEDIAKDSPVSHNGLGVVGCENRTPLITIRFKNNKLANKYKEKIKYFIFDLLKLHKEEANNDIESDIDLDLEIWPEDVNKPETNEVDIDESLFFVDTDPNGEGKDDIPKYTQVSSVISNLVEKEPESLPAFRRGPICFNCDGDHCLRDCQLPRNNTRIAEKRKNIANKLGRYHVEDDQKYGHLVPGRISNQLRHALGLKRHELPLHIYRMRVLGYPPGWLEEARISHSGITMFDSAGNAILDDGDEEGQICEVGSKDKFDIKKILDFPGFNVTASTRYKEEGNLLGMPPMCEHDSKLLMLQTLAPNAMKAYKRKKLTFFPSGMPNNSLETSQAEMELDSGDEVAGFPSVPPLPDDAPPPPPPPPKSPPPPPKAQPSPSPEAPKPQSPQVDSLKKGDKPSQDRSADKKLNEDTSGDDMEIISVIKVTDIPVPEDDLIIIDEYFENVSQNGSGRNSPTLDDLEEKKIRLLTALDSTKASSDTSVIVVKENDEADKLIVRDQEELENIEDIVSTVVSTSEGNCSPGVGQVSTDKTVSESGNSDSEALKTKTGNVKTTLYGTPVINVASPYLKLPSDDKFAKNICDVINFENLPNSTGKYKKICTLLKKVKSEVDRIQES